MTTAIKKPAARARAAAAVSSSGEKSEWRFIGPREAEELLKANVDNYRNIDPVKVTSHASDMSAGRWLVNGATICIDRDGKFCDGQHRMHAVVKSGVTLEFNVVTGLLPEAVVTIDTGRKRTFANVLKRASVPNPTATAAVANAVLKYINGQAPTIAQSEQFVMREYDRLARATILAKRVQKDIRGGTAIYGCAAYFLLELDEVNTVNFMGMFAGIVGVDKGHPVYALRKRFRLWAGVNNVGNSKPPDIRLKVAYIFKAWNLTAEQAVAEIIRVGSTETLLAPVIPERPLGPYPTMARLATSA